MGVPIFAMTKNNSLTAKKKLIQKSQKTKTQKNFKNQCQLIIFQKPKTKKPKKKPKKNQKKPKKTNAN